jgi:hypothetical protein
MRRRLHKAGMTLLLIVMGILSLYPITLFIVHLPPVQNFLLSIFEEQINRNIQGEIEIGSFRTNLITSIAFYGISGSAPGEDSLYLEKLHVDFSLLALFDHTILLNLAGAAEGRVTVVRDSTGALRFPLLPIEMKTHMPSEKERKSSWTFEVDSGFLDDINLTFINRREGFTVWAQSIESGINPKTLDSLAAWFSVQQLSVRSPWWNGVLDTLYGRGIMVDSIVNLQRFILAGSEAHIEASGTVPLTKEVPFNIGGTVAGRLELLSMVLPEQDSVKGSFTGSFTGEGTMCSPRITSRITSSNVKYREYVIDSIYVQAHYTQEERLRLFSFIKSDYGIATIDGSAGIPGLLNSPQFTGYNADATVAIQSLNPVLRKVSVDFEKINGSAVLNIKVKSDSLIEIPDTVDLYMVIHERGPYNLDSIKAHLVLNQSRWQLQALAGTGNEITGDGLFRMPRTLSGQLNGDIHNPAILSSIALQDPVTGSLSFTTSFEGLLGTPELQADVRSDSVAWRGAVIRDLATSVRYNRELLIDSAHALLTADIGEMKFPELDSAGGMLTANITAEGTLSSPVVEAQVHLSDPVYRNFSAETIAVHLLYNNERLYWDSLLAVNDTIRLTSGGQIDVLLPRRFVQAGLNLEVRGFPAAGVKVTGTQEGDTIKAEALVDHLAPGRFVPGFPMYPCYEGNVDMKAVIVKSNCLRIGILNYDFVQYAPKLKPFLIRGGLHYAQRALGGRVLISEQANEHSRLTAAFDLHFRNGVCPGEKFLFEEGSAIRVDASDLEYGPLIKTFLPRFTAAGTVDSDLRMVFRGEIWNMDGTINANADTLAYPPAKLSAANVLVVLKPRGSIDFLQGKFSIMARQFAYGGEPILDFMSRGTIYKKKVVVDTLRGNFIKGGGISVSGTIPYGLQTPGAPNAYFIYNIDRLPITLANPFLQMIILTDGMISGNGQVNFGGKISATGQLVLNNGRFTNDLCMEKAGPINARIRFSGDSIILSSLSGKMGGGDVQSQGFVQIGRDRINDFGLELSIDDSRFNCEMVTPLGIDNAKIQYAKKGTGYLLTATVSILDTRIQETITIPEVIGKVTGEGAPGVTESTLLQKTEVDATLVLNRNLLIDTNFGRLLLDGRMRVTGTLAQPSFNGVLQVAEGKISYLDRNFDITEGTLRQYNPYEINPELIINASSNVTTVGPEEPHEYKVTVSVRGTMRKPEISVVSDPPLERPQIVTLLTLGSVKGTGELGARTGEIASSQITGLGSQFLEQALNVDNISITGNIFSIPEGGGLTITLSENITSDLSVIYQTDVTNPANQGAIINYRLFPHFRVIAQTYTEGTTDVGFRYTIRR